jgi:hypothetical protein
MKVVEPERKKAMPEDMVAELMQYVQMETSQFPMNKRFAVERYMRTFLRRLTKIELQAAVRVFHKRGILHPDITYKINQASEGYDNFMWKRGISY